MATIADVSVGTSVDSSGFRRGFRRAQTQAERFQQNVTRTFAAVGRRVAQGLGVATAALTAFSVATAREFERVSRAAASVNIPVDQFSRLSNAFQTLGLESDDVLTLINDVTDRIGDAASGNETYRQSFDAIGVSWQRLRTLSPADAALEVVDALARLDNAADRSFRANELLASLAERLGPAYEAGADGIRQLAAASVGISQSAVAGFASLNSEIRETRENFQNAFGNALGQSQGVADLTAAVDRLGPSFVRAGEALGTFVSDGLELILSLFGQTEAQILEAQNRTTRFARRRDRDQAQALLTDRELFGAGSVGARGTRGAAFGREDFGDATRRLGDEIDATLSQFGQVTSEQVTAVQENTSAIIALPEGIADLARSLDSARRDAGTDIGIAASGFASASQFVPEASRPDETAFRLDEALDVADRLTELGESAQRLVSSYNPLIAAQDAYRENVEVLQASLAAGAISNDDFTSTVNALALEFQSATATALAPEPSIFEGFGDNVESGLQQALLSSTGGDVFEAFQRALQAALVDALFNAADVSGALDQGIGALTGLLGFQSGGRVPSTGPIFAHAGEVVLNAAQQSNIAELVEGRGGQQFVFQLSNLDAVGRREVVNSVPVLANALQSLRRPGF